MSEVDVYVEFGGAFLFWRLFSRGGVCRPLSLHAHVLKDEMKQKGFRGFQIECSSVRLKVE